MQDKGSYPVGDGQDPRAECGPDLRGPRAQEFAVIGDEEVHLRCGAELWQQVADKMSEHFGQGRFSDAIIEAIGFLAGVLTQHFPRRWRNPNELPDDVIEG